MSRYQVWLVPVPPEGNFLVKEARMVHECDFREEASEWLYFEDADEPAPDKHDFRRYEIREENSMGYGTNGLSFRTLRQANIERLPLFKDATGKVAHKKADGSDWSPAEWLQAVIGELGELANELKKVRRGDFTLEEIMPKIRKEFADVAIYLDIFAYQYRFDLGDAIREKFNEVSRRVDVDVFIGIDDDWHRTDPGGVS